MPLTPHHALLCVSDSAELGEELTPLHLRLLHLLTCHSHTLLPVNRIVPDPVGGDSALFWRRSVPSLQVLHFLLQRIELLLHPQQGVPQFPNLPPLPHKWRGGLHIPYAAEFLKIGLTLLACRGNLL